MKRTFTFITLVIITITGIFIMSSMSGTDTAQNTPGTIEGLWKEYESARAADRPQKQMEVLEAIKALAARQRLPWDFYKAGDLYVRAGRARNWKLTDSLNTQFQNEIKAFDEPVLTFFNTRAVSEGKSGFIRENKARLKAGRNPGFYTGDANITSMSFSKMLPDLIENDYEYALWSMVLRFRDTGAAEFKESSDMLKEVLEGRYPNAEILELVPVLRNRDSFRKKEELEKFADKYKDKAVSLFARQELLNNEFSALNASNTSTSEQYKALRSKGEAFEMDRKAFASKEKILTECCQDIVSMNAAMDSKAVFFDTEKGIVSISLRNLDKVDVIIKDGDRTVWSTTVPNPAGSYYAMDTVSCVLPKINDGEYSLICRNGKVQMVRDYARYTLSMAQKLDVNGYAVYPTDAETGEPIKTADLELLNSKETVIAEHKGLEFNGFAYLPQDISKHIDKDSWKNSIRCSFKDRDGIIRKTRVQHLQGASFGSSEESDHAYASIFVDRSSFNPEETVQFKVLAYHGDIRKELQTMKEGKELTARLFDAQGKEISSKILTTNEFGSAAGEFFLERRERNGNYRIAVYSGSEELESTYIKVDDFVLPTFDLTFDRSERLYFPGDEMTVSGEVKSYSGHSLAAADIHYTVTGNGKVVKEDVLNPDNGGRFSISFLAEGDEDYLYYNINVRVTDSTGETLSWNTGRTVQKSIPFSADIENAADASLSLLGEHQFRPGQNYGYKVISEDTFVISLHTGGPSLEPVRESLKISYTLKHDGRLVASGSASPGETLSLDTSGHPSGQYIFEASARDKDTYDNEIESLIYFDIYKVKDTDDSLPFDAVNLFKIVEGDDIALQIGSTTGPVWACVEVYGLGDMLLGSRLIHIEGEKGKKGSLTTVRFNWADNQPDLASLHVIYFRDYNEYSYSHTYDRRGKRTALPLAFTRFEDRTLPHSSYSFEIQTSPEVECVAAIFDKSTERIMSNHWNRVMTYGPTGTEVYYSTSVGNNGTDDLKAMLEDYVVVGYGKPRRMLSKAAAPMMTANAAMEEMAEEEMMIADSAAGAAPDDEAMAVRENFANTIAFEPFLRSDAKGRIKLDFTTADKLSTYCVQLFAHDKNMENNVLRQEMTVTIPVKISVAEPLFLYEGDKYSLKASLSSSIDTPVGGTIKVDFYDGNDYKDAAPIKSMSRTVRLDASGALSEAFAIDVPSISTLGIRLAFISDDKSFGSDAVFVQVPVLQAVQSITEAHSSILHDGESFEALLEELKSQFVNTSGDDARVKDISIIEMVRQAIPEKAEPESDNVLSLSEALYVRLLAQRLGAEITVTVSDEAILEKILACRTNDGGFAWFNGMGSSPVITATLLQRYASLRDRGIIVPGSSRIPVSTVKDAVEYMDKAFFGDSSRPGWCGGISMEQYITTRSLFPEVKMNVSAIDGKELKTFRKDMKEYLIPKKERGLEGYILGKARRMRVLLNLIASEDGKKLANDWGVRIMASHKMLSSLAEDMASIEEYAVEHRSGGWYYPNAVMPFRGLLENEAYAHAFIADLLRECLLALEGKADKKALDKAATIADGISLWLMVQKETQKWDEDAAFVDAISTVMDASEKVLKTRVISLSKTFTKPFEEIKATGNGLSIERVFYIEKTMDGKVSREVLKNGEELAVGDKVIAEYRIWNEENRSFVRITAPRMASLRPVNQISGHYGWWLRPLSVAGWHTFSPHGYRNVLKDRTEYWFDSYPEKNTIVTEEFFVTQSGTFQMPVMEIESLYSPHYRANGDGIPAVDSE